jgi:hypothetical protein|eukprot:COSAG06_NODE_6342_length_2976_cov_9.707642_7_plen_53_part_00
MFIKQPNILPVLPNVMSSLMVCPMMSAAIAPAENAFLSQLTCLPTFVPSLSW